STPPLSIHLSFRRPSLPLAWAPATGCCAAPSPVPCSGCGKWKRLSLPNSGTGAVLIAINDAKRRMEFAVALAGSGPTIPDTSLCGLDRNQGAGIMSGTSIATFTHAAQQAQQWVNELADDLDWTDARA